MVHSVKPSVTGLSIHSLVRQFFAKMYTAERQNPTNPDTAPLYDVFRDQHCAVILVDKLKELNLGVKTEKIEVEKITIDEAWLLSI